MRSPLVLASILRLSVPLLVTPAIATQDVNPYGRIDPVAASTSVLRRAVGLDGTPGAITALNDADPPRIDRLLDTLLDHPTPGIRTVAALEAAERGVDPLELHARLGDPAARAAFVLGLLGDDLLSPDVASALLDTGTLADWPIARAIVAAAAGGASGTATLDATLANDELPAAARGIAAGVLESTRPGTVERWIGSMETFPAEIRDRVLFETSGVLERLDAVEGLRAFGGVVESRPADDAIRAGVVLGLLRLAPAEGMTAWSALARASGTDRGIPTAMLLLSAEREVPLAILETLPTDDPLQQAVHDLLAAAPAERPAAAIEAVRAAHLPTIRWLLEQPRGVVPPDVLDEIIEAGLVHRRTAMIDTMLAASLELGATDPARLVRRLAAVEDDDAAREILLRGLVHAGTPESADAARAWLDAPDRKTRSLALLAMAAGGRLDAAGVRRLGRAAAGGGGLPEDLRPLAAWHHLVLEDRIDDVLPTLLTP